MKLFTRLRGHEEVETPARHFLASLIQPLLAGHPQVKSVRLMESKEGPLGGIADTYVLTVEHEDRETVCRIAIYGDSPEEVRRRFDG